jgi:hypothetical protein
MHGAPERIYRGSADAIIEAPLAAQMLAPSAHVIVRAAYTGRLGARELELDADVVLTCSGSPSRSRVVGVLGSVLVESHAAEVCFRAGGARRELWRAPLVRELGGHSVERGRIERWVNGRRRNERWCCGDRCFGWRERRRRRWGSRRTNLRQRSLSAPGRHHGVLCLEQRLWLRRRRLGPMRALGIRRPGTGRRRLSGWHPVSGSALHVRHGLPCGYAGTRHGMHSHGPMQLLLRRRSLTLLRLQERCVD